MSAEAAAQLKILIQGNAVRVPLILKNPVYCGKIAYGRRKRGKFRETRNEYHLVDQDKILLVDGLYEAIIPEDVWDAAQAKKYERQFRQDYAIKSKLMKENFEMI